MTVDKEGSVDVADSPADSTNIRKGSKKARVRTKVELYHCDIIGDEFWTGRPNILAD